MLEDAQCIGERLAEELVLEDAPPTKFDQNDRTAGLFPCFAVGHRHDPSAARWLWTKVTRRLKCAGAIS